MSDKPGSGDWQDRRAMFQKGKELHTPSSPTGKKFAETGSVSNAVRRASASSGSGDKSPSGSFPTAGRRSSNASGGLFGNLQNVKRGSQDYGERRASQSEMMGSGGGVVSGWFNSTFKGHAKPGANQAGGDNKRGVME